MPKKTFKDNTAHLNRFFSGPDEEKKEPVKENTIITEPEPQTHKPHGTHDTDVTHGTQMTHEPPARFYRLNLKLKAEYKEYLDRVSWEAHKSITQYLNDLIEADKDT